MHEFLTYEGEGRRKRGREGEGERRGREKVGRGEGDRKIYVDEGELAVPTSLAVRDKLTYMYMYVHVL